ncbi:MAG: PAS domain S-box protein [Bacteroidetes bacterium]|nr:MAG: PAS domain S-box protein [Bacteroidota bacterium]
MPGRINMLKTILDEIESGFIILKMIFDKKTLPHDFSIIEVNVPFEEISGIMLQEFVGMNHSMVNKDLQFLGFDWLEEYASLAVDQKFRNREKYLEQNRVYLRVRTFIPQPGYLVIIVSDITPIRRVETDTRMDVQRFRSLLENCNEGFLFFSVDQIITSASTNIPEVLGYTEEELKLSPELVFLPSEDKGKVRDAIQHVLIFPRIAFELEIQVIQKDGTRLWFEGTFHNMLQAKGVNSIVLKLKEITRRKNEEFEFYHIASRLLSNYPI